MASSSPKKNDSERVLSTTLCVEQVDKDGHVLRRFCVTTPPEPGTMPPQSITSPDTLATNDGLTDDDLWGNT